MHILRPLLLALLFCGLCVSVVRSSVAEQQGSPRLVEVRKIWDAAPHNAFTDLVRFKGAWYCAFREGKAHVSPDGALRVITSRDGVNWESAARITSGLGDLRDAKLTITPDNRLMLCGAAALHPPPSDSRVPAHKHQSLVWFSKDGREWSRGESVGDRDVWLWRVTWHEGQAYGIGYSTVEPKFVRLYASREGRRFREVVDRLFEAGYPNEHALVFMPDDTVHCLLRRDAAPFTAQLGTSRPPYIDWSWRDLGKRVGGPALLRLPDGRIVAGTRLHDGKVRTALSWLDPEKGTLTEFLSLPSGGDSSYPGLVWHDGLLWVSYYSSHEGKTSIYLAKVALPGSGVDERGNGRGEESGSSTRPLVRSSSRPQAPLQAAYAEADITPPLGGSMPGYFQDRKATGVLDPLKSKVLLLRQGDESVALVSCDLVGIGASVVERIRRQVAQTFQSANLPPPRHVWVHATHTHTGGMPPRNETFTSDAARIVPDFYQGVVDESWVKSMVERTAAAILRATKNLAEERELTQHEGREGTVAHYRRFVMKDGTVRTNPGRNNPDVVRPAGEIDPRLTVLRFGTNRTLAVIYGLHPDCVGGTQYSADYPHHMTERIRRALGADWNVLFLNACCGNINHINVRDTNQLKGYDESRRIGETLGAAVVESLKNGTPLEADRLESRTAKVTSRLRRPTEAELSEAEERIRTGREPMGFNTMFAPAVLVLAKTADREHPAEVGALRLGSFGLATMPGEIFVELGREVEAGSPFKPTRTIGLTNGAMGYIPTRKGYAEGGYEANWRSARYEPENGHRWAAAAARMLQEMGPSRGK